MLQLNNPSFCLLFLHRLGIPAINFILAAREAWFLFLNCRDTSTQQSNNKVKQPSSPLEKNCPKLCATLFAVAAIKRSSNFNQKKRPSRSQFAMQKKYVAICLKIVSTLNILKLSPASSTNLINSYSQIDTETNQEFPTDYL